MSGFDHWDIVSLKPTDTPDYMIPAWLSCIHWAVSEPSVVAAFRRETGMAWEPGRTGIERMIDQAAGMERVFAEAFVKWVNVELWGPMDGPPPEAQG